MGWFFCLFEAALGFLFVGGCLVGFFTVVSLGVWAQLWDFSAGWLGLGFFFRVGCFGGRGDISIKIYFRDNRERGRTFLLCVQVTI